MSLGNSAPGSMSRDSSISACRSLKCRCFKPTECLLNGPWRRLAGRGLYVTLGQSGEVFDKGLIEAVLQLIHCTCGEQLSK